MKSDKKYLIYELNWFIVSINNSVKLLNNWVDMNLIFHEKYICGRSIQLLEYVCWSFPSALHTKELRNLRQYQ